MLAGCSMPLADRGRSTCPVSASNPESIRPPTLRGRRLAALLLLLLSYVGGIQVCSGQIISPEIISQINEACLQCDNNFLSEVSRYQRTFYTIGGSNPLETGRLHCAGFAGIKTCYQDCLQGYTVTYSSFWKKSFDPFYSQFCDPGCQLSFLPGCYVDLGLPYDLYTSGCDTERLALNSRLVQCINQWTSQQNCSGVCTPGQRSLSGLLLMLESICLIPSWEYACSLTIELCMEQYYGAYGINFVEGGPTLDGPGNESCSAYGGLYDKCLKQTVSGQVTIGTSPYDVVYYEPCSSYADAIAFLTSLSDAAVKPLCDNPYLNLTSICSPRAKKSCLKRRK